MFRQNLAADVGRGARRGRDACPVGAHHLAAEGLLFIRHLDHVDLAVQTEEGARHAQSRAPLSGTGLGGDALQSLHLGIVGLRDGGVQLVAARRVVALELIVDLRRRAESLLEEVGAHERRGAVHLVEVHYLLRNVKPSGVVVYLLFAQLGAENRLHLFQRQRRACGGVEQRRRLVLHVCPHVVPLCRNLFLRQVDLVRYLLLHYSNGF